MWWLRIKSLNIERKQNKRHFIEYLDCHESDAWIKTIALLVESSSPKEKCSMETLVAGSIPVITEKYEFDYRNKPIILNIIKNFSVYRDYDGRIRKIGFSTKSLPTNLRLSIGTLMEQTKLIVTEK